MESINQNPISGVSMDPAQQPLDILLNWFQNISILVLLVLLYNFIPDRFFMHRDRIYSIFVGLIFTFAAVIGIVMPWSGTEHPSIGVNGILVPLAGMVGGPISAAIITGILLIIQVPVNSTGAGVPDTLIILTAGIIGSGFYIAREKRLFRLEPVHELLALSSVFAILTIVIMTLFHPGSGPAQSLSYAPPPPVLEVAGIIFIGLFLLGSVIWTIDRKRDDEYELFSYKEHLEALVQERTSDLERINSLQEATIESTTDGIIVTDLEGMVNGWNKAGSALFHLTGPTGFEAGIHIISCIREQLDPHEEMPEPLNNLISLPDSPVLLSLTLKSGSIFDLSITPHQLTGETIGRVYNFRDITKRKRAEEKMKVTNQKLLLLSGITRHDILNQITALKLYLHLVRDETTDESVSEYMGKMDHVLQTMQEHMEFTSDYQDVGLHDPIWQDPFEKFDAAAAAFTNRGILFTSGESMYEILADPLLERVFYNCIDNSIRHGERVTQISFQEMKDGDDLLLVYTDDGIGVAPADKDRIFAKGFGKHTGFGMFLIKEILSITGISISETGEYGSGVRFEIRVSPDNYRSL